MLIFIFIYFISFFIIFVIPGTPIKFGTWQVYNVYVIVCTLSTYRKNDIKYIRISYQSQKETVPFIVCIGVSTPLKNTHPLSCQAPLQLQLVYFLSKTCIHLFKNFIGGSTPAPAESGVHTMPITAAQYNY